MLLINPYLDFIGAAENKFGAFIFTDEKASLRLAKIVEKPSWMPFETALTTIGKTVYYPEVSLSWTRSDMCGVLLHEAMHLAQYRRLTVPVFLAMYSIKSQRLKLELEAFQNTVRWFTVSGQIPRQSDYNRYKSSPRVVNVLNQLRSDYGLDSVDSIKVLQTLAETVRDTFAKVP